MNQQQIRQGVWTVCGVALSNSSVPPAMVVACMAIHCVRRRRQSRKTCKLTGVEGWRSVHGSTGTGAAHPNPRPHGLPARMADTCASAPASRNLGHGLNSPSTIEATIRVHSGVYRVEAIFRIAKWSRRLGPPGPPWEAL